MIGFRVKNRVYRYLATALIVLSVSAGKSAYADGPFGGHDDISYAATLWATMVKEGLVGTEAKALKPFFGGAKPHGMILELAHQNMTVGEHTGFLVVKRNYDGDGATVKSVSKDRAKYLGSVTIMFTREEGYDADNLNWFWAKYHPDGSLYQKGTLKMAGRINKGATPEENRGCLYCHSSAGGGDYIFYPQISLPGFKYGR